METLVASLKLLFPTSRQECAKQPEGAYRRVCAYRNIYAWGSQMFFLDDDDDNDYDDFDK